MGLNANAELVWGIPVLAYDDDFELTGWWDEENDDWRKFGDTDLYVHHWGHYEDPDNQRGILSSKRIETFSADCWDPIPIGKWKFNIEDYQTDAVGSFVDDVVIAGFESLLGQQGWWLVATYG